MKVINRRTAPTTQSLDYNKVYIFMHIDDVEHVGIFVRFGAMTHLIELGNHATYGSREYIGDFEKSEEYTFVEVNATLTVE